MKKLYQKICLGFGIACLLTACNDDYLERYSTFEVADTEVFSTADNLIAAINGMHRNMYYRQGSQGSNGYTAQLIIQDCMGEDLIFPTQGNGWFVEQVRWLHNHNDNSFILSYYWNFWYTMILNANMIINRGGEVSGSEDVRDSAIGQAYAYRAFGMFQLVQTFAKSYHASTSDQDLGIVIRTDYLDNFPKERATVSEVYNLIQEDLDNASALLEGKSMTNNSHISYQAVQGIRARVALVKKEYALAASSAREARAGASLMSNNAYLSGFNDFTNPEWIWGVQIIDEQSDGFGNFHAYMSRNYSSTQIRTAPKVMNINLYNAFPENDVRIQVVDPTGQHSSLNLPNNFSKFPYTSQKFISQSVAVSLGDIPFMRAAEMYLIEAEALYYTDEGSSKAVLEELVRNRQADPNFSFATTGPAYLDEILINRRLELWGEGFRFHDLKRLQQPLDRSNSLHVGSVINNLYNVQPEDNRWQWVIPRQEINSNPIITQNPTQ